LSNAELRGGCAELFTPARFDAKKNFSSKLTQSSNAAGRLAISKGVFRVLRRVVTEKRVRAI
jgi:hypothetical protein